LEASTTRQKHKIVDLTCSYHGKGCLFVVVVMATVTVTSMVGAVVKVVVMGSSLVLDLKTQPFELGANNLPSPFK
jgi:hypothetical protein